MRFASQIGRVFAILVGLTVAKTRLGIAKTRLGGAKSRLSNAKMRLGRPRGQIAESRTRINFAKDEFSLPRAQPITPRSLFRNPPIRFIIAQFDLRSSRTQLIIPNRVLITASSRFTKAQVQPIVGTSLRLDANPQPRN